MTTPRQEQILNWIIKDYLELAEPVSSDFLEKKHRPKISPATLRIEMKKLTDENYLTQPHTSAGRIPTDRGYRFFVDRILKESKQSDDFVNENFLKEVKEIRDQIEEPIAFFQNLTQKLAKLTSALAISYSEDEGLWLKEGWQDVLEEPEFKNRDCLLEFFETAENWEEISRVLLTEAKSIKIFIGEEIPLEKACDFSIIISRCELLPKKQGFFTILGPKRMSYRKNIELMNSLTKL